MKIFPRKSSFLTLPFIHHLFFLLFPSSPFFLSHSLVHSPFEPLDHHHHADSSQEASSVAQVTGSKDTSPKDGESSAPKEPSKADIEMLKEMFLSAFNHPRNTEENEKNQSRSFALDHFQSLGLETFTHEFVIKHRRNGLIEQFVAFDDNSSVDKDENEYIETGINLIGILPSKLRVSGAKNISENLLVIASHYDTVQKCPGVDDNGSGSVTTLVAASLLSRFVKERGYLYESTSILFVLFDLEEKVRE